MYHKTDRYSGFIYGVYGLFFTTVLFFILVFFFRIPLFYLLFLWIFPLAFSVIYSKNQGYFLEDNKLIVSKWLFYTYRYMMDGYQIQMIQVTSSPLARLLHCYKITFFVSSGKVTLSYLNQTQLNQLLTHIKKAT